MNKKNYLTALKMAWPSVLESFFIALAGMIDTMMVGSLGSYAIAAVGLTTQPKFIALAIFISINIAVSSLVARRRGQKDQSGANTVFLTAMLLTLLLCLLFSFLTVFFADDIIRLSGSQPDTHPSAVVYYQIIMGGMIFNLIAMTINAAQRGSGNTKIAFVTNLTSSVLNVFFNYLLIGGKLGFPALGIKGAAIATVLGSVVAMFMSIRSLFKPHSLVQVKYILKNNIHFDRKVAKIIGKLSSSMYIENLAMRIGFLATALTAASLGTNTFAIHNAGMNVLGLGFSFADGMQVAAVALAGKALGEEKPKAAIEYGQICQRIGLIISVLLSAFLFFFGRDIMGIYFNETQLIDQSMIVIDFTMIIVLLQISQIIYAGCLRSGGDVKYTLFVGIISASIIRTAVTIILVNVFHFGLTGIWIGILSDQLSRFIFMRHRFKGGRWTRIRI
ncbi:MATE family efflux transporter [Facklamia miroungae]|uniref:Probable multidrug resistance protein NorM n=1 Tax=Facklamia miroungae TaxID=120956 RepID=A0A1G7T9M1_9LACT|nr:MATE family efflux transporter [Facklamia miroungae]NKZ29727.1 MATE family efflux transporter [Facklamia miroungae]SDG31996.1 putative efflux protein, MATE family [Facklamia miroungae]